MITNIFQDLNKNIYITVYKILSIFLAVCIFASLDHNRGDVTSVQLSPDTINYSTGILVGSTNQDLDLDAWK